MRLDFESNIASLPLTENGVNEESVNDSNQTKELLREGVKAAQAGNRATARLLLLRVTELEPENENAWLWLASISEYPEELLGFLANVLKINPHNERALEWTAATNALLAKTFVQRGIDASKEDRADFSRECFQKALELDGNNEMAWLWLASLADSDEEKQTHLEKVLSINPANESAQTALHSLQTQKNQAQLRRAQQFAAEGNRADAAQVLAEVLEKSPELAEAWILKAHLTDSFDEKIKLFERALEADPVNETARAAVSSLRSLMQFSVPSAPSVEQSPAPQAQAEEVFAQENHPEENPAEYADEAQMTQVEENQSAPAETEAAPAETEASFAEAAEVAATAENYQAEDFAAADSLTETISQTDNNPTQDLEMPAALEEENYFAEQRQAMQETDENPAADVQETFAEAETAPETADNAAENTAFQAEEVSADVHQTEDYAAAPVEVMPLETSYEAPVEASYEAPVEASYETTENAAPYFSDGEVHTESYAAEETAPVEETEEEFFAAENAETEAAQPVPETAACMFCETGNDAQSLSCHGCRATISLSDLERLLNNEDADKLRLQQVVTRTEMEKNVREFNADELVHLGIAHINLKNMRQGFTYLQEGSQMKPNDVLLASQVNALAIRLSEIEDKEESNESKTRGKTILVVDDSATVRKLISGKLEKSGHEVVCAVDGMDALAKLNEIVPDLILLDITMPRMDGYQVCKLIRNSQTTKNIPVVMISGKDGFFDKVRGRMAGTTGYITKPFGPETLMKALEIYITTDEPAEV